MDAIRPEGALQADAAAGAADAVARAAPPRPAHAAAPEAARRPAGEAVAASFPGLARPDGALISLRAQAQPALARTDTWSLANELLMRLQDPLERFDNGRSAWMFAQIGWALQQRLNLHDNRFSMRHYLDLYGVLHAHVNPRANLEGATVVDLGCGGLNPLGLLTVFLALGARRGIGIDLDAMVDPSIAARAVADVAAQMAIEPRQIAWDTQVTGTQVLQNLASFRLGLLAKGDPAGIDAQRLAFRRESIYAMTIADGEADIVLSNAFLEHIPDMPRALAEIARITRQGGYSVHNIDMTDHRRYGGTHGALDFLREASTEPIVQHCNRLRRADFVATFERAGFTVVSARQTFPVEATEAQRAGFALPFRDMPLEELRIGMAVVVAQKR